MEIFYNVYFYLTVILVGLLIYITVSFAKVRNIVNGLVLWAELNIVGTKKGAEKREFVINAVYHLIPTTVRIFVPKSMVEGFLESSVIKLNDYLDDGVINNSVDKSIIDIVKGQIQETETEMKPE